MKISADKYKKMHPLESLGVTPATRGDIRVERLHDRIVPKVPFPHKHDFFQIVIVHSSKGVHEIDFHKYKVTGQQIFVIKPGQVHTWTMPKTSKGFVIEYTNESFSSKTKNELLHISRMVPDHAKIPKELASLKPAFLEFMEKEFLGKNPLKASILEHYLSILLLELYRGTHRDAGKTPTEDLVTDFSDLVETHFREQHHLKFYADKLKVSPKALSGKIQKALGRPAKEIILQRCLLEAKRLLSYSPLSVSEIGYELGFDDPNYFSRFLKTYLRVSAVTFRKNKGHGV